jgi:hypothetical protein
MSDDLKQYNIWLDRRGQETLEHLKTRYGASISGAFRAGLDLIRKQIGLDRHDDSCIDD